MNGQSVSTEASQQTNSQTVNEKFLGHNFIFYLQSTWLDLLEFSLFY